MLISFQSDSVMHAFFSLSFPFGLSEDMEYSSGATVVPCLYILYIAQTDLCESHIPSPSLSCLLRPGNLRSILYNCESVVLL